MKITNEFTVPIPIDQAWKVLTDLEGIAPCMPGAQLTGVEGEVYKGKVKVKVGPVISDFSGTAQFTSKDDTAYQAVIDAKGRDARSAGNAAAVVSASLTAESPTSTKVSVDTDLKISGKLAQFGSGMIKEVSSKLLAQFVANLEKKLATDSVAAPAAAAPVADQAGTAPVATAVSSAVPATASAVGATPASTVAGSLVSEPVSSAASASTASEPAVATAPDAAVALGEVAPAAPETDDSAAPAIPPDPSAGEVEPAAGRLKTAEGTPEPIAPLRTPDADLSAAASIADPAPDTAAAVSPSATPSAEPAAAPASSSPLPSSSPEPAAAAAAAAPPTERTFQTEEPEAIDLLAVAGSSIYKRVIPVAIGAVVVAAVIVWFVARG